MALEIFYIAFDARIIDVKLLLFTNEMKFRG